MSKTKILIHIVFSTKCREKSINPDKKRNLFAYIHGLLKNKGCSAIRINGMSDHIHILLDLHPSVSLSDLVKTIKGSCSNWMKNNIEFIKFKGWGKGYYAVSIGREEKEGCRQYIINQEEHHKNHMLLDELERIMRLHEMEWFPDDWD